MWWRRQSDVQAVVRRPLTPLLTGIGAVVAALAGVAGGIRLLRARNATAKPAPLEPLGPDAVVFYGSTPVQNTLAGPAGPYVPLAPPEPGDGARPPIAGGAPREIEVLVLIVDTSDHRFGGTQAQLQAYRDTKFAALDTQLGPYWLETSFGDVDIKLTMRPELLSLGGTFDDYFNRNYIAASLTSSGLAPAGYPLTFTGTTTATLHVRDSHNRNVDVVLAPNGTFGDAAELSAALQTTIDAVPDVPANWVACTAQMGELHFELAQTEVSEGTFIRVRSGSGHAVLGLDGPVESPGDTMTVASLTGKPVPGGFPVALAGTESVDIEVRDENLRTRRFTVSLAAGRGPDEEVELRARLLLDDTKISPDPGEEPGRYAFSLHAFIATQDSWLPFGGITANVHPGRRSKILFQSITRGKHTEEIVVNAVLQGPHRANQTVDAAVVASNGTTYEGTAVTASNGRVAIPVGMPPAGKAEVMLYYFGPAMTSSSAGPLAAQVP